MFFFIKGGLLRGKEGLLINHLSTYLSFLFFFSFFKLDGWGNRVGSFHQSFYSLTCFSHFSGWRGWRKHHNLLITYHPLFKLFDLPFSLLFLCFFFLSSLLLSNILFHLMQSFATSENKKKKRKKESMAANQLDEKTNGDTNDTNWCF